MNADDLAFVHVNVRVDQHAATFLQVEQGEAQRLALHHGDQHTIDALGHVTRLELAVVAEGAVQDASTRGECQELAAETDQATAGNEEFQANPALAVRFHVGHFGLAQTQLLHDGTLVLLFHIGHHGFVGLLLLAVLFADNHLGATDRQLEAFTTHILDQHRQVQFTTAGHAELVGAAGFFHAQSHVVL